MSLLPRLRIRTVPELLRAAAGERPDAVAASADDGQVTNADLLHRVEQAAGAMAAAGVGPGGRVGVLLPNGVRWLVTALGAQFLGAAAVPLNTWSKRIELERAVAAAPLTLVVAQRQLFGTDFAALLGTVGLDAITRYWERDQPTIEGLPAGALPPGGPAEDDVAFVLFTSGSSAGPKAVPLLHRDLLRNGHEMGRRQRFQAGERLWIASPFFFSMGSVNALGSSMVHGVELCIQERYETESSLDLLESKRCSIYYGLPAITRALLASPTFTERDLSALRTGIGAMSPADKHLAVEQLGVTGICSVYGLTESYTLCTMTDPDDPLDVKVRTQGTVLPTHELRVVLGEREASPDEVGDIEVRGCVTPGYLGLTGDEAARYWHDGWFRTGDLGSLDTDGRLTFVGRSTDTIKTSAILVSPAEVEAALTELDGVGEALVFGVPDEELGQAIGAVVVPSAWPDLTTLSGLPDRLRSDLRSQIASYKVPHHLWFVSAGELPLTDTGKYSKRALLQRVLDEDWITRGPAPVPGDGPTRDTREEATT